MTFQEISRRRLQSQFLLASDCKSPGEMVAKMGAIQGQDFRMAKMGIASRLITTKDQKVEEAIDQGEIIRTHIMRPTWHLVAAEDIYWLLDLTSPHQKNHLRSRHKQLGISDQLLKRSNAILEKSLRNDTHLTRDEIYQKFEQAKIPLEHNWGYHLLFWAENEGLICSGAMKETKITYALLEERVPKKVSLSEEEALCRLARKYFSSHGPATIHDFSWWSGLNMKKARLGFESIKSEMLSSTYEDKTFWFFDEELSKENSVIFLPAYDEFLIGYKDKSISLPYEKHRKKVHHIGTFRPFIVIDGIISGIWKMITKKEKINLQIQLFVKPNKKQQMHIEKAANRIAYFLEKEMTLNFDYLN